MEPMAAPRGPCPDESPSTPLFGSKFGGRAEVILDRLIELLVLPLHPSLKINGSFFPYGREIEEMYTEVQFCLWSMFMALAVYLELLNSVDISVRHKVSDVVGQFLADWRDGRGPALADALDELIIRLFRENRIADIPDMARLQRIKDCAPISSTVAAYIKDLTMKLDKSTDLTDSTINTINTINTIKTIESLFPVSQNFIGRCFFPRLAAVSRKLLELIRRDPEISTQITGDVNSLCSSLSSLCSF